VNDTPNQPPALNPQTRQNGKEESKTATGIATIGMLVGPLIAALGGLALTGTIGRVQRDDPLGISIAIGLVIVAGVLWVAAETFTAPKANQNRSTLDIVLRSVAFVFAAAGFILALAVAVATANNEPRPKITPTLSEDGGKLTTHVTASNLPTNHRLAIRINTLKDEEFLSTRYRAYVGPDSDGNVDQSVTIPLPEGDFTEIEIKAFTGTDSASCDDFAEVLESSTFGSGTGCVIIAIPPRPKSDPPPKNDTHPKPKPHTRPKMKPTTGSGTG
jgi:hypothetical protein